MRISTTSFIIMLCCVIGGNCGFLDKLKIKIKIPKYTIGIPRLPDFSNIPSYTGKITDATTTAKTTTVPELGGPLLITETPPPPPPPPTPTEKSEDQLIMEQCLSHMRDCPWTIDELVEKIEELQNVDTSEFSGEGDSKVGPVIDPDKVNEITVGATVKPGLGAKTGGSTFPKQCLPCCDKSAQTSEYIIDCTGFLSDESLKWYYQRRNAMNGCFKCRNVCELKSVIKYL